MDEDLLKQMRDQMYDDFYGIKRDHTDLKNNNNSKKKKILQFDLSGNLIGMYNTLGEASLKTKLNPSNISRVIKGKAKTAGGYRWTSKEK